MEASRDKEAVLTVMAEREECTRSSDVTDTQGDVPLFIRTRQESSHADREREGVREEWKREREGERQREKNWLKEERSGEEVRNMKETEGEVEGMEIAEEREGGENRRVSTKSKAEQSGWKVAERVRELKDRKAERDESKRRLPTEKKRKAHDRRREIYF